MDHEKIKDRLKYYTDGKMHFGVLEFGTIIGCHDNRNLTKTYSNWVIEVHNKNYDSDNYYPYLMDDGGIFIRLKEPCAAILLKEDISQYSHMLDALNKNKHLTPPGPHAFYMLMPHLFQEIQENTRKDMENPKMILTYESN